MKTKLCYLCSRSYSADTGYCGFDGSKLHDRIETPKPIRGVDWVETEGGTRMIV